METLQPNKYIKVHMFLIFACSTYTKVTSKYFPLCLKELYIPVLGIKYQSMLQISKLIREDCFVMWTYNFSLLHRWIFGKLLWCSGRQMSDLMEFYRATLDLRDLARWNISKSRGEKPLSWAFVSLFELTP